jgi:hypothetical protein
MSEQMNLDNVPREIVDLFKDIKEDINTRFNEIRDEIKSFQKKKWGLVTDAGSNTPSNVKTKNGKKKKDTKKDFIKKYKKDNATMIAELPTQPQQPYFKYGKDAKDKILKEMYEKSKEIEEKYRGSEVEIVRDKKTNELIKVTWNRRLKDKEKEEKAKEIWDRKKSKKEGEKGEIKRWSYQSEGSYQYNKDKEIHKKYKDEYERKYKIYIEKMKEFKRKYPNESNELFTKYGFKDPTVPQVEKKKKTNKGKGNKQNKTKKEILIGSKTKKPTKILNTDANEVFDGNEYDF